MGSSSARPWPLFNEKVIFPVLESLHIMEMGNITEIWDKQSIAILEEIDSFCQLKDVSVKECNNLMHVFPSKMHALFKNLKELSVRSCGSMKGIVEFEGEIVEDGRKNEACFNKLIKLQLWDLPSLVSFCTKLETVGTTNDSATIRAQPLFNKKVIFPLLEKLSLDRVGYITEIWDKQSIAVLEEQGSFCRLMDVKVYDCAQLTHVFPSKMHALLKNLKELWVGNCGTMKGIVEFEGEIDEDGLKNEVCFSKLSNLQLGYLPSLVSFCTELRTAGTTNDNATILAQPLFNEKVAFPALKDLSISYVPNIRAIWDKKPLPVSEKETQSFCKLQDIEICGCEQLVYVLPSYMLSQLQINLQKFEISHCEEVEVIVSKELKENEATDNDIIVFHQLKELQFRNLPKLKSWDTGTQLLFPNKAAFPALEDLNIQDLPNITAIWDKKPLPESEKETQSFCKLRDITVWSCDHLEYVLPSYMLPQLQNLQTLKVYYCEEVEVIVSKVLKENEATDNDIIVFHQLKDLSFRDLPKLKSWDTGTQLLFPDKVILPVLEKLRVEKLDRIEVIWDKQSPSLNEKTDPFSQLRSMEIRQCKKLVNLVPSNILPRMRNLRTLWVEGCPNVEFVVFKNGKEEEEGADDSTLTIPQLRTLHIYEMEKLKSFYSSSSTTSLFNHQVTFPRLENLELDGCESLRCIFKPSMARVLVNLQELIINDCSKMEAVVDGEEEIEDGQGRKGTDKTLFPHLSKLELRRLPELRRFCHFRYPVELPLLSQMVIEVCPRLNSFSSGSVSSSAHALMVLFNDKVQFPRLENLELEGLQNMDYIWGSEYPTSSLSKLKCLKAKCCVKLKNIFRPSMVGDFVNLEELIINDCSNMEAVVDGEDEDGQRRKISDETLFPHLTKLELRQLPELRMVCQFTHPFKLQRLSQMVIEVCPRLNSFSSGSVSAPNLFARDVSYDFDGDNTTVTPQKIERIGGGTQ